ncbi:MAG TPA: 23S rRNA (adenine(2503)-C(2))-methyltransferase RlmN [Bacteroidales bacterium]|nr:23S rRNA (adenine(2503)-C(2))-methyltransferase RlmN [Bacteroidales bacterium]
MKKMQEKKDIRQLSLEELVLYFEKAGEKKFRATQVYEWIWKKGAVSFDEMTNLSKSLRLFLEENFFFHKAIITEKHKSKDKTLKTVFSLFDEALVEGVLIPTSTRVTACISTQVGCPLKCVFCATGSMGYLRNLSAGEIFDQVVLLSKLAKEAYRLSLTNIVVMGMGEPLLNYKNTLIAIKGITSPSGLGMSPDRITLSTAGIPEMIRKLADDKIKFNLSVSLHSANDMKRNRLMPVNSTHPLDEISKAIEYFHEKTGIRVTFEYLLLGGFNDQLTDAQQLAVFCKKFPVKINLIEYNETENSEFKRSKPEDVLAFEDFLKNKNMLVQVRRSRGQDIAAACGQLVKNIKSGNYDKKLKKND